jgi:hypothetical protein
LLDLLGLFCLWPSVVVCDFDPDLSGIFSSVAQIVPQVVLAPARHDDLLEIDPGLANDLGLLVIVKQRHLQLVVIRGVVNCES